MMPFKTTLTVAMSAMLLAQAFSANLLKVKTGHQPMSFVAEGNAQFMWPHTKVDIDKCDMCLSFASQALNALLQLIVKGGVVSGCGVLCNAVADKTSKDVGIVCNLLCDYVGIEEFIKIIERADLDPIYYCELLPFCPVNDHGDAKLTKFQVTPKSGPRGVFTFQFEYASQNGTGTGEICYLIHTVDGLPVGDAVLHELAGPGTYDGQLKLKAVPDPSCDPTTDLCEEWLPGNYTVTLVLWNGECGSKHPHSAIYDQASAKFTITNGGNY